MTSRQRPEDNNSQQDLDKQDYSESKSKYDFSDLSEVEKGIVLEQSRLRLEARVTGGMRAYLVSAELTEDDPAEVQESLQELGSLVRTLGDECVGATVQKRSKLTPHSLIGTGKASEVRQSCIELNVDYVVCDKDLSPSQVRNLEKIIERPVLDRTGIILQIFGRNAKTREAKTQVEIAHLEYLLPRLANAWIAFERQRGTSSGMSNRVRGAGETQIELDRRRVREKIVNLRKDLEKIRRERDTQRKGRMGEYNVVLVGYTNAGKTTIMNALTDSHLSANSNLFETLDSAVRLLKGSLNPKILLTDTVGFIRNLPHSLVASFQSTLEETARADLLIHVVDASHPRYRDHMQVTDDVLKSVGAGEVPRMYVFNKVDLVAGGPRLARIYARNFTNSVCISAENRDDIKKLRESVVDYFARNMEERKLTVRYTDTEQMALVYTYCRVLATNPQEDAIEFVVRAPSSVFKQRFERTFQNEQRCNAPNDIGGSSTAERNSSSDVDDNDNDNVDVDRWDSGEFSYAPVKKAQV